MAINKVEYGGETLIDLTGDNVQAERVFAGDAFHNAAGEEKVGTFTIDEELTEQDSLIAQIAAALVGKTAVPDAADPVILELTVTENGTYTAPTGVDGYSPVVVNIPVPETPETDGSDYASGEFTLSENLSASEQTMTVELGFAPSAVVIFRKSWERGTQSINIAFAGGFNFSVCSTSGSSKAVEKLVGSSYITKTDAGFTITGNSTYYWVGGVKYIYFAVP